MVKKAFHGVFSQYVVLPYDKANKVRHTHSGIPRDEFAHAYGP